MVKLFLLVLQHMKKYFWLIFSLAFGLLSCQREKLKRMDIEGAWKIDSSYTFYNGFEQKQMTSTGNWPIYVFEDGIVKEIKSGSFRSFFYSLKTDTLILRPTQGGEENYFSVLSLEKDQMILKKTKLPLFKGNGQNRYEIRYFSRTETPKDSLVLFMDPRIISHKLKVE